MAQRRMPKTSQRRFNYWGFAARLRRQDQPQVVAARETAMRIVARKRGNWSGPGEWPGWTEEEKVKDPKGYAVYETACNNDSDALKKYNARMTLLRGS